MRKTQDKTVKNVLRMLDGGVFFIECGKDGWFKTRLRVG